MRFIFAVLWNKLLENMLELSPVNKRIKKEIMRMIEIHDRQNWCTLIWFCTINYLRTRSKLSPIKKKQDK